MNVLISTLLISLRLQNCAVVDECCDASTCLLKSWALCRSGTCCQNCLPRQSNEVCRSAMGECDAAEFCDGLSGEVYSNTTASNSYCNKINTCFMTGGQIPLTLEILFCLCSSPGQISRLSVRLSPFVCPFVGPFVCSLVCQFS